MKNPCQLVPALMLARRLAVVGMLPILIINLAFVPDTRAEPGCIGTLYSKTVIRPNANWLVYLADGTVFMEGGSDFLSTEDWAPGEEVLVCSVEGHLNEFAITNVPRE